MSNCKICGKELDIRMNPPYCECSEYIRKNQDKISTEEQPLHKFNASDKQIEIYKQQLSSYPSAKDYGRCISVPIPDTSKSATEMTQLKTVEGFKEYLLSTIVIESVNSELYSRPNCTIRVIDLLRTLPQWIELEYESYMKK